MRTKQLSWPSLSTNVLHSYGEGRQFGHNQKALRRPQEAPRAYLKLGSKLYDIDINQQYFDSSFKTQLSLTTLVSSCTTLCPIDAHLMEDSCLLSSTRLPPQKGSACYRSLRWRLCTPYRKLFSIVFLANLIAMMFLLRRICLSAEPARNHTRAELTNVLTAVSINLTASIAIRNEHVINMLFRIFVTHVTPRAPLAIRRVCAKVYHFGGFHSGGGVAAGCWYCLYTAVSMHDFIDSARSRSQTLNMVLTSIIWALMFGLLVAAYPRIRARMHDWFEISHRFFGWIILVLFWAQTLSVCIFAARSRVGKSLVRVPTFWALLLMTLAVIYPWARVKRVQVRCEALSEHALRMHVDQRQGQVMQPCRVIAISHSPLKETHKFATVPEPNGGSGYSMVISRAGDWTANIINHPPKRIWIKGAPAWGVLRVATMFSPVVIVATGSGIGPCLGLFNGYPEINCRVVWQARAPRRTYGNGIVDTVLKADKDALIVDTEVEGRKDMVRLAIRLYQESTAEAVVVISNTEGTYRVVRELESRGIPAYGPIWDS